jgi:phosphatidate phosphatase
MVFVIVYLEARLRVLKLRYLKSLIQLAALITAFVTSISRISDYHHRYSDVLSGSILGITIALFITVVVGRVIWMIDGKPRRFEFEEFNLDE